MNKQPAVYILSSKRNGTLYVGVTSDLVTRVWEHKNNFLTGFRLKVCRNDALDVSLDDATPKLALMPLAGKDGEG